MLEIKNKVALITGGASGIGKALAETWTAQGGKVVIGDINEKNLEQCSKQFGDKAVCLKTNVTKEEDTEALAKAAADHFGGLHLVAPCAGIIHDMITVSPDRRNPGQVKKMPLEVWQKVVDINLTGVFLTVRDSLEQMVITQSTGAVILISSTGSLGTAGQLNYSSTKAAMSVFPKVLTAELMRRNLSDRIRVNAVAPGYTQTPMTSGMNQNALDKILDTIPIGRMSKPDEVVSLMLELYRNEALAGEVFFVHGGLPLSLNRLKS